MFAAIFIPNFCLQSVLRHEPELASRAVALIDPDPIKPSLVQVTSAARSRGVCEGLTASQAMARCGDLIIRTRSPTQEQAATEVLLQTAYAFSPNVESTAPGVCTMESKGLGIQLDETARPFGSKILQALGQFHLESQIGFAATPSLALLAARSAKPLRVVQDSMEFVSALPVTASEPPLETLEILNRWGIQTIGALLGLGKDAVVGRLGGAAAELFDRVSIHSSRPLKLIAPPLEFSEQMEFEREIETTEPLLFVLRRFVEQLSRRLELAFLVISEFQLRLGLSSGGNHERVFKIPAPTANVETLFRILRAHLETVRTDSPIVSLRLDATPSKPGSHQFGLFETTLRDPNQFAETLGRLMALCGPDRVGTPQVEASHQPDAFWMQPPHFDLAATKNPKRDAGNLGLSLRRFRPAISAIIEFRGERPALLRSPSCNGPIVGARGPFLSSGNWWDDSRWAREEWDVQIADGSLYRIFRSRDGSFVEGVYD